MPVMIYNTLTRRKEQLLPREAGRVSMYVCGVTPYAPAHVGHGRSAVAFDVVRRWLTHRGYDVNYVMNVTDIEDKIMAAARAEGRSWREVAEQYTASYLRELRALNVLPPTEMPWASEHVEDIVALVQRLIEAGHAYALSNGDVCFHVPSFEAYGRLSRRDLDSQITGARVEEDQRKKDPRDFFLWKAAKPEEPSWDSPWGKGRPGWHIECSAMSRRYLGDEFDIHGGGTDLLFPHHENEVAQSEAASGKPFARIWMHNGMLSIAPGEGDEQEKMSKSLGNVVGLREVLARVGGAPLRYYYTAAHYRSDLPFSETTLQQAESALDRLRIGRHTLDRLLSCKTRSGGDDLAGLEAAVARAAEDFEEAMDDDFSTPRALAALHGLVGVMNRFGAGAGADFAPSERGREALQKARAALVGNAGVLALDLEEAAAEHDLAADLMEVLIEVRRQAREEGHYDLADQVRARLAELGIALEDRPEGTTWRRG